MIQADIVIIGAGPAGYEAALAAAKAGLSTYLIEKEKVGGVCLNRGCIPTKTYLINAGRLDEQLEDVMEESQDNIESLGYGMNYNLKKAGVNLVSGTGVIWDNCKVKVEINGETLELDARNLIIATGSALRRMQLSQDAEHSAEYSIEDLFAGKIQEKEITIIGAGAVGVEAAVIANAMGKNVTVVEQAEHILGGMDQEMADTLMDILEADGISFSLNCTQAEAGAAIPCCGREAIIPEQAGENKLKLKADGSIWVDENFETSLPDVYALGDCNGIRMEANVAKRQAEWLIEKLLGQVGAGFDDRTIAKCVYTPVEFVSVGLTEQDMEEGSHEVYYSNIAMTGAGRIHQEEYGQVKVIAEIATGQVKGVHILSKHASEMGAFAALAIMKKATVKELKEIAYLHPTLSEAFANLSTGI